MKQRRKQQPSETAQLEFSFTFPPIVKDSRLLSVTEIYETMSQSLVERLKEDGRIELKTVGIHSPHLGDYFSMWANTKPDGGVIIVGVEKDSSISGCTKASQNHINDIEKTRDIYCPDAGFYMKRVVVKNINGEEDFLIIFRIFYRENKVVRTVRGDAFIRSADTKRKLSEDEAHQLEIEKGQVDFEQETSGLKYPQDFDLTLIKQFVNAFEESRQLDSNKHSNEDILQLNHLGKIETGKFR